MFSINRWNIKNCAAYWYLISLLRQVLKITAKPPHTDHCIDPKSICDKILGSNKYLLYYTDLTNSYCIAKLLGIVASPPYKTASSEQSKQKLVPPESTLCRFSDRPIRKKDWNDYNLYFELCWAGPFGKRWVECLLSLSDKLLTYRGKIFHGNFTKFQKFLDYDRR